MTTEHVVIAGERANARAQPLIQLGALNSIRGVTVTLVRSFSYLFKLPAAALLAALWLYQKAISPLLPVVLGPSCGCRFAPTCSHYAIEAVKTHGAWVGTGLTFVRLLKCSPLHPGGFDPVPVSKPKFSCVNIPKATPVAGR